MRMRVLLLVGVVVAALAAAVGVFAYPYFAGPPVTVSGPSPFAGCPFGAASGSVNYPNSEVEPFVAVDPTDPNRLVGVFQQDRWNDGGAHGLIAARSSNGGATWQESWAAFSKCSDPASPYDRASDPWVTFDTAGNVYQISLSVTTDQETWEAPTVMLASGGCAIAHVPELAADVPSTSVGW